MGMRYEPCWPRAVLTYARGRAAKSAPQSAIPNTRLADHSSAAFICDNIRVTRHYFSTKEASCP